MYKVPKGKTETIWEERDAKFKETAYEIMALTRQ